MSRDSGAGAYSHGIAWPSPRPQLDGALDEPVAMGSRVSVAIGRHHSAGTPGGPARRSSSTAGRRTSWSDGSSAGSWSRSSRSRASRRWPRRSPSARSSSTGGPDCDEVALAAIFDSVDLGEPSDLVPGRSLAVLVRWRDRRPARRGARPGRGTLTVRAIFGGGLLVVPDDWQVDLKRHRDHGRRRRRAGHARRPADAPSLIVDGFALFGGFAVMSSNPRSRPSELDADTPDTDGATLAGLSSRRPASKWTFSQ